MRDRRSRVIISGIFPRDLVRYFSLIEGHGFILSERIILYGCSREAMD